MCKHFVLRDILDCKTVAASQTKRFVENMEEGFTFWTMLTLFQFSKLLNMVNVKLNIIRKIRLNETLLLPSQYDNPCPGDYHLNIGQKETNRQHIKAINSSTTTL